MILIPGLASSSETWDSTVARYQNRYECHLLTLAGFAGKPALDAPFLDTVRQELAVYIREKKLDHPVIVGHSLGGFLALWLSSSEPELTGHLVIVDSLPFLPAAMDPLMTAEKSKPMAESMRAAILKADDGSASEPYLRTLAGKPEDQERLIRWSKSSDRKAMANAMYDLWTTDLRSSLGKIKVPVLVMGTWIAYRQFATRESVERNFRTQYADLPGYQFKLFDSARHFIMFDDPDGFFAELDAFLSTKRAPRP